MHVLEPFLKGIHPDSRVKRPQNPPFPRQSRDAPRGARDYGEKNRKGWEDHLGTEVGQEAYDSQQENTPVYAKHVFSDWGMFCDSIISKLQCLQELPHCLVESLRLFKVGQVRCVWNYCQL
jgi:hypothetical protein